MLDQYQIESCRLRASTLEKRRSKNWISAISVLAALDIDCIGHGQILAKIHRYQPKYRRISNKIPVISQINAKMEIFVSEADMLVKI